MITPAERAEMYRGIRSVLARHYVNLGLINVLVTPFSVRLSGRLQRLPGGNLGPLTADIAEEIYAQLRHLRNMRRLELVPDPDVGPNLLPIHPVI
ncbi:MAG: hypothetical protein KBA51_03715 [Kiritimatiellae bacterium]|nr:hypothetical protein [Kiritimatiellia bacterium]